MDGTFVIKDVDDDYRLAGVAVPFGNDLMVQQRPHLGLICAEICFEILPETHRKPQLLSF